MNDIVKVGTRGTKSVIKIQYFFHFLFSFSSTVVLPELTGNG